MIYENKLVVAGLYDYGTKPYGSIQMYNVFFCIDDNILRDYSAMQLSLGCHICSDISCGGVNQYAYMAEVASPRLVRN